MQSAPDLSTSGFAKEFISFLFVSRGTDTSRPAECSKLVEKRDVFVPYVVPVSVGGPGCSEDVEFQEGCCCTTEGGVSFGELLAWLLATVALGFVRSPAKQRAPKFWQPGGGQSRVLFEVCMLMYKPAARFRRRFERLFNGPLFQALPQEGDAQHTSGGGLAPSLYTLYTLSMVWLRSCWRCRPRWASMLSSGARDLQERGKRITRPPCAPCVPLRHVAAAPRAAGSSSAGLVAKHGQADVKILGTQSNSYEQKERSKARAGEKKKLGPGCWAVGDAPWAVLPPRRPPDVSGAAGLQGSTGR